MDHQFLDERVEEVDIGPTRVEVAIHVVEWVKYIVSLQEEVVLQTCNLHEQDPSFPVYSLPPE